MRDRILEKARFNPKVCTYWLLSGIIVCVVTIVGIPLLLLWIPIGSWLTRRYLERMDCVLTSRNLLVKKGIFVRTEKTIPLEKITDLGMIQGPIMRHFGLHALSVETAGQSGAGALVSLTGIVEVEAFREKVLDQRDRISEGDTGSSSPSAAGQKEAPDGAALAEIQASLRRIEKLLEAQLESMKEG